MTPDQRKHRVELATHWLATDHPWGCTISSDEKKFNFDGPDNWSTYMDKGRNLTRTKRQCGGGSVMVWAMLLPNGFIHIERLEGRVNTKKYLESDSIFGHNNYIYQQDNCSIHRSDEALQWFETTEMPLLSWPSKSPDLNIVENLWSMISDAVYCDKQ